MRPVFAGPQHLLTLSSVEDDGLGEELQIVWEIEPVRREERNLLMAWRFWS